MLAATELPVQVLLSLQTQQTCTMKIYSAWTWKVLVNLELTGTIKKTHYFPNIIKLLYTKVKRIKLPCPTYWFEFYSLLSLVSSLHQTGWTFGHPIPKVLSG